MTVSEERQFAVMCSSLTLTKPWAWLSSDGNYGFFSCFISIPSKIILIGPKLCLLSFNNIIFTNNLQTITAYIDRHIVRLTKPKYLKPKEL